MSPLDLLQPSCWTASPQITLGNETRQQCPDRTDPEEKEVKKRYKREDDEDTSPRALARRGSREGARNISEKPETLFNAS